MQTINKIQLRIGQLAGLVGVTPKTIRHYHKIGLMPPPERTENNYRQYDFSDLYRLNLILRLKAVGFSLADIKSILQADSTDAALQQRLKDLEERLSRQVTKLQEQRQQVQALLDEGVTLQDVDRPEVQSSLTYQLLAEVMKEYAAASSADVRALDRALLSRLDMFSWGEEYRAYWLELAHSLVDSADVLQVVGDRIIAASRLEKDDPELELMADEVASELLTIHSVFALPEIERPLQQVFSQVVIQAVQETLTPAQRQLVGLVRRRLYGERS